MSNGLLLWIDDEIELLKAQHDIQNHNLTL